MLIKGTIQPVCAKITIKPYIKHCTLSSTKRGQVCNTCYSHCAFNTSQQEGKIVHIFQIPDLSVFVHFVTYRVQRWINHVGEKRH